MNPEITFSDPLSILAPYIYFHCVPLKLPQKHIMWIILAQAITPSQSELQKSEVKMTTSKVMLTKRQYYHFPQKLHYIHPSVLVIMSQKTIVLLVLCIEIDEACSRLVAIILTGRSHVMVSASTSGGPCHVAMSV